MEFVCQLVPAKKMLSLSSLRIPRGFAPRVRLAAFQDSTIRRKASAGSRVLADSKRIPASGTPAWYFCTISSGSKVTSSNDNWFCIQSRHSEGSKLSIVSSTPPLVQGRAELGIVGVYVGDASAQGIELVATGQVAVVLAEIGRVATRTHCHDFPLVAVEGTEVKGVVAVRVTRLLEFLDAILVLYLL